MCGRFLLSKSPEEIARWFATRNATPNSQPHYNVAPTQDILAVRFNPETKERALDALRWGLVPYWANDIKIGYSLINAKAETVAEKPAFREAFKSRRCLIAADGFYEWKKLDAKAKQPVRHHDGGPQPVRLRWLVGAMEGQGERGGGALMYDHHN